jgi:hypothetical protein
MTKWGWILVVHLSSRPTQERKISWEVQRLSPREPSKAIRNGSGYTMAITSSHI